METCSFGAAYLVDGIVEAGHDAHDLSAARVDANGGTQRVRAVDGLGSLQLPGTRREGVGLAGERTHWAEVDHVACTDRTWSVWVEYIVKTFVSGEPVPICAEIDEGRAMKA